LRQLKYRAWGGWIRTQTIKLYAAFEQNIRLYSALETKADPV
jgi:hypothetical protein